MTSLTRGHFFGDTGCNTQARNPGDRAYSLPKWLAVAWTEMLVDSESSRKLPAWSGAGAGKRPQQLWAVMPQPCCLGSGQAPGRGDSQCRPPGF